MAHQQPFELLFRNKRAKQITKDNNFAKKTALKFHEKFNFYPPPLFYTLCCQINNGENGWDNLETLTTMGTQDTDKQNK